MMNMVNTMNNTMANTMNNDIESFMSSFGIRTITTQKDEGLLSKDTCTQRILSVIATNIQNFKSNAWNKSNQMLKLLIEKENASIFTVRIGGKKIYRCALARMDLEAKIHFLEQFYKAVKTGVLDTQIEQFCEDEVKRAEARKAAQREKQREKRNALRYQQERADYESRQNFVQY